MELDSGGPEFVVENWALEMELDERELVGKYKLTAFRLIFPSLVSGFLGSRAPAQCRLAMESSGA